MRTLLGIAALLSAAPAPPPGPAAPPSQAPPADVIAWTRAHATPAGAADAPPDAAERAAVARIVAGARVIGFGEDGHGQHEPLAYRNRLVRQLAENGVLTAVALESGLTESRALYDYVLGGPGDALALVRTGLTHDFGALRENLELVEQLRAWNVGHPGRRVRLYGVDLSTIQSAPPGAKGYGVILKRLDAYLRRTAPEASARLRSRLHRFAGRFTEADYPAYTSAERAEAARAAADLSAFMAAQRGPLIRAGGALDYAWAAEEARDVRRLLDAFATWTDDPAQLGRLAALIDVRDRAMADHLNWVLAQEGPRGRVLLFQSDGHVAADPVVGSVMRLFPRQPAVTGVRLRARLGARYRAVATVSSWGRSAGDATLGSVDRAFAAARTGPAWMDLRAPGRPHWWSRPQSVSQGEARVDDLTPARAFDALLYLPTLTPVTPLPPPPKAGSGR